MPSKRIYNRAVSVALQSEELFKVGAVLFKGSAILRSACNTKKYIGYRERFFPHTPTRHAEIAVMHGIPRDVLAGCDVLVVRITRRGDISCSKPCKACILAMKSSGIRKVHYTDYNKEFQSLTLSEIDIDEYEKDRKSAS